MSKRTITLTNRPPVTVDEDKWPLIASASDKEFDNQYEFQANRISKWGLYVRQHEDGRALVYAHYSYSSNWQNARCYKAGAGVMLPTGSTAEDICRAIREVGEEIAGAECNGNENERWPTLIAACIADMPAEELD